MRGRKRPQPERDKRLFPLRDRWLAIALCLFLVFSSASALLPQSVKADDGKRSNPDIVKTFTDNKGRQIDEVVIGGKPPKVKARVVMLPEPQVETGTNVLSGVPAYDWCYGCSATSAAMMCGYYDRNGYANMYTGPAEGGVCPLNNETAWESGESTLSATHQGYDSLGVRGHVDDYWSSYGSYSDPYYGSWAQHTYADCTADFMGTNQYYNWNNPDGGTRFFFFSDGSPLHDYSGHESQSLRDGCRGLRLFIESRGYDVIQNYNQYIYGYDGNTLGFTFAQYKAQIDAGRPVLIHVIGHTMLGIGYADPDIVYLHDTWDHGQHSMTWGGNYQENPDYEHYSVTVIEMEPPPVEKPPAPTLSSPASGATVPGASIDFQWNSAAGATKYWLEVNSSASWDSGSRLYYAEVGNVLTQTVAGFPDNGTVHYWRVWAGNDAGWCDDADASANSRSFTSGSAPLTKPPAPTLVSPASGATVCGTSIDFQWNSSTGATKYWLEVNSNPGWTSGTRFYYINVGDVLTKTVTGFPNDGTVYYWRVWAGNDAGWCTNAEASANSRSFTNQFSKPPAPALVSPANGATVSGTSIDFQWTASGCATKYWLEVNSNPTWTSGTRFYYINVGNVLTQTVTGFPNDGTVYYWRVWAGNSLGWCPDAEATANSRSFTSGL